MTDAEHADLSRRLALAIGWPEHLLRTSEHLLRASDQLDLFPRLWAWCEIDPGKAPVAMIPWWPWRPFDYRNPAVVWPIAERYNCFPFQWEFERKKWGARMRGAKVISYGDTAAEAVVRAVIGART